MPINLPLEVRFWNKIDKRGPRDCWNWVGATTNGYGVLQVGTKLTKAPRIAWSIMRGKIPRGLCVLHKCDNRLCVNPRHLFIGTRSDNNRDRHSKGRTVVQKGEDNNWAKLTTKEVMKIRRIVGLSPRQIAPKYGVSWYAIWAIQNRKTWKHVP